VEHVRAYVVTEQPWLASDPILDPPARMPGLDVVQTGAWLAADDRPLPPDLHGFLEAGDAPVYAGFGSMPMHGTADPAQVVVEAIRAAGRRAIVGRGWADLAAIDGNDCFLVGDVNHHALFPQMAAIVHHGGAGTTVTAARSGRPQVVVPQAVDQPYWAGRVAALGIGVAHEGAVPTVESLTAALTDALAPEPGDRAAQVAGRIRPDGTAVAAQRLIERFG
jgi:vancomycin aglycone glucosyltransferase